MLAPSPPEAARASAPPGAGLLLSIGRVIGIRAGGARSSQEKTAVSAIPATQGPTQLQVEAVEGNIPQIQGRFVPHIRRIPGKITTQAAHQDTAPDVAGGKNRQYMMESTSAAVFGFAGCHM